MDSVNLGATGLRVSRVCLGMMSYGNASDRPWVLDEDAAEPIIRAAVESGIYFFDTANVYSNGASEVATGRLVSKFLSPRRGRHRDEGLHADDARPERWRVVAEARPLRDRRLAAATEPRVRGPLPDPSLGPERADRGDDGRAERDRACGQGALHRREQHARVAVREGAAHRRAPRLRQVRLDAEPLQPPLPRGGAGDDPAVPGPGDRRDPVEPIGPGRAGREPDPRRREVHHPRPTPTRSRTTSTTRATSTSSTASRRLRPSVRSRPRRSRSRGYCIDRASRHRSSARRSSATSRTRWLRSSSSSAGKRWRASKRRTSRTRCSATDPAPANPARVRSGRCCGLGRRRRAV